MYQPCQPLDSSIDTELSMNYDMPVSPIPQHDGPSSINMTPSSTMSEHSHLSFGNSNVMPVSSSVHGSHPSRLSQLPSPTVHHAMYTLNQPKQIEKLRNDSLIPDFDIHISPSQENVNIQCSAGFYSVVLRPCCEIFQPGFKILKSDLDVQIQCRNISKKTD